MRFLFVTAEYVKVACEINIIALQSHYLFVTRSFEHRAQAKFNIFPKLSISNP